MVDISTTGQDSDLIMCSTPTNVMILHILVPLFMPVDHSQEKLQIFPRSGWAWPKKAGSPWRNLRNLILVILGTHWSALEVELLLE